jgi:putative flippase GtrA
MDRVKKFASSRAARFVVAGLANTATNFLILNLAFYSLHLPKLIASIVATACAITLSFVLNRGFVFASRTQSAQKLPRFLLVSVAGVLFVQNTVFALCISLMRPHEADLTSLIGNFSGMRFYPSYVGINLSNAIATLTVMIWNYQGYKLFVFKETSRHEEITQAETA